MYITCPSCKRKMELFGYLPEKCFICGDSFPETLIADTIAKGDFSPVDENEIGEMYYNGKGVRPSYVTAAMWFRKAAEKGYAQAQFNLGYSLFAGKGIPKNQVEGVQWYIKASEQGSSEAQYALGDAFYYGEGIAEDRAKAAYWYLKAAVQGNMYAQDCLGMSYYYGEGVNKNLQEALKWYRKAAEQGLDEGQFHYGLLLGAFGQKDECCDWLAKAAEQGHELALERLKIIRNSGNN